jgi:hypothetical protein
MRSNRAAATFTGGLESRQYHVGSLIHHLENVRVPFCERNLMY